ncbi:MAG: hypothetical protein FD177_2695 [Desulfovibrionaceae bacterium]|nr:MAG: hypothetical protein FD177_2695 [Desulfovibrionaceae bacterium]
MNEPFSKRFGYYQLKDIEIKVRQDAPYELRGFVVQLAYDCGVKPKALRLLVCSVLRTRPDIGNYSDFPNVDEAVRSLVDECDWFRVYDIIEKIAHRLSEEHYLDKAEQFNNELNEYFVENGIGWKIVGTQIEARGSEIFEDATKKVITLLAESGFETARNEMHEALRDLSRRPNSDVTGAIQHSMAALECVARELSGDRNATLGKIMQQCNGLIPKPLDDVVSKVWGYASENARHVREGQTPTFEEAELVVTLSGAISIYLARKKA